MWTVLISGVETCKFGLFYKNYSFVETIFVPWVSNFGKMRLY